MLIWAAVLIGIISQPAVAPSQTSKTLKKFSSLEGRFSVLLPNENVERSSFEDTRINGAEANVFTLKAGKAVYLVKYADLSGSLDNISTVEKILDSACNDKAAGVNGTLSRKLEISIDGFLGREIKVDTPEQTIRARLYLVKQRLYQLEVIVPLDEGESKAVTTFLDSFKLINARETSFNSDTDELYPRQISGGLLQGTAKKKVAPSYPQKSREAGVGGPVKIEVLVSEEGKVVKAIFISGPESLRDVALAAAWQWTFNPIRPDGIPVKVRGVLTFQFAP